jgi:hypothetical protein
MAQKDNPYLTITLTKARPVKIKKEDWPVVASAEHTEKTAVRLVTWKLTVREHADGRAIVYGVWEAVWPGHAEARRPVDSWDREHHRGGELLPAHTEVAPAIDRVATDLQARLKADGWDILEEDPSDPLNGFPAVFPRLAQECTERLPALELQNTATNGTLTDDDKRWFSEQLERMVTNLATRVERLAVT